LPESEIVLWHRLFDLRSRALQDLEKARQAKTIGKALEAQLKLLGPAAQLQPALAAQEQLRELLNVSALTIELSETSDVTVILTRADGKKCERCWHWETDIGSHTEHPTICSRCVQAISEAATVA
jgi:isoleucyl-tRNA synthetase